MLLLTFMILVVEVLSATNIKSAELQSHDFLASASITDTDTYTDLKSRPTESNKQSTVVAQQILISTTTMPATTVLAQRIATATAPAVSLISSHISEMVLNSVTMAINTGSVVSLLTETVAPVQQSIIDLNSSSKSTISIIAAPLPSVSVLPTVQKTINGLEGISQLSTKSSAIAETVVTGKQSNSGQTETSQPISITGSITQSISVSPIRITVTPVVLIPTISWVTVITGTLTDTSTRWISAPSASTTPDTSTLSKTAAPSTISTGSFSEVLETTVLITTYKPSSGTVIGVSTPPNSSTPAPESTVQGQASTSKTQFTTSSFMSTSPPSTILAGYNPPNSDHTSSLVSNLTSVQVLSSSRRSLANTTPPTNGPPPPASSAPGSSSPFSTIISLHSSLSTDSTSPSAQTPISILAPLPSKSAGNKRLSIPVSIRLPAIPDHVVTSAKSRYDHIGGKNLVIMSGILCCMVVAGVVGSWVSWHKFGDK